MMNGAIRFAVLMALLCPAGALAEARLDETYTLIELEDEVTTIDASQPNQVRYRPTHRLRFYGDVHDGDAVRVIWKQGGSELANVRCPLRYSGADRDEGTEQSASIQISDACWSRNAPLLEVHGEVDVEVHYLDDEAETATLIRTLHIEVARTWRVDRVIGGAPIHSPRYFVRGDDLLGMSWVWLRAPTSTDRGRAYFYFWAHTDASNYPDASLRCYRDGERVSELEARGGGIHQSVADWHEQDDAIRGGERASTHYRYRLFWITANNWIWGEGGDGRPNLTAEPGRYVCKFRSEGTTVREFHFTVADGTITPHPAQASPDGLSMRPGAFFVETRFGDAAPIEIALNPDAIRRGTAFGHAWADAASLSEMLNALPDPRGESVPALPDGVAPPRPARGRGRGRGRSRRR